jgi:endogenous inhibitor of DNA gyrase (YacG/DUF329 family)
MEILKDCPSCGSPNAINAYECHQCGYNFDDIIKCPHCGEFNFNGWKKCKNCKGELYVYKSNNYENNNFEETNEKYEYNKKTIFFKCIVCNNNFSINTDDDFNAFVCKKCRSIFTYEWKNNKLIINIIKKEEIIPNEIIEIIKFFDLKFPILQENLKRAYHKILSQYHPDKVSHLGRGFKELSERKTKEIINKYELLQNWLKDNEKD